mmetsp:Transcript_50237/g.99264  ORF Transcript_50237/g.99264 Transcript_50237/m.99264 type:complete len:261 (-) Transcript_50237:829-1611(-)
MAKAASSSKGGLVSDKATIQSRQILVNFVNKSTHGAQLWTQGPAIRTQASPLPNRTKVATVVLSVGRSQQRCCSPAALWGEEVHPKENNEYARDEAANGMRKEFGTHELPKVNSAVQSRKKGPEHLEHGDDEQGLKQRQGAVHAVEPERGAKQESGKRQVREPFPEGLPRIGRHEQTRQALGLKRGLCADNCRQHRIRHGPNHGVPVKRPLQPVRLAIGPVRKVEAASKRSQHSNVHLIRAVSVQLLERRNTQLCDIWIG